MFVVALKPSNRVLEPTGRGVMVPAFEVVNVSPTSQDEDGDFFTNSFAGTTSEIS